MPHLPLTRKEELRKDPKLANSPGDYNFLFTLAYLTHWLKEGNQRYAQAHKIRYASMQPTQIPEVNEVENLLVTMQVNLMDRIIARDLAFGEFKRLVIDPYEDYCIAKNGSVEEYVEAAVIQENLFDKLWSDRNEM